MSAHSTRLLNHTSRCWRRVGQSFSVYTLPLVIFVLVAVITIAAAADTASSDGVLSRRPNRRAQLSYKLTEELPAGTVIADDLIGDAGLGAAVVDTGSARYATAATTKRRSVGLVLLETDHHLPFRLENDGRRLVTTEIVDRDARCPQQATCRFEVDLAVLPSSSNFEVMFAVLYIDVVALECS